MFLHKKEIIKTQGVVTQKYKKPVTLIRGGSSMHYFIQIKDINNNCSGTSRIGKQKYEELHINDDIPVRSYKNICLAVFDVRMYAPPLIHFLSAGLFLLISLVYLLIGLKEFIIQKRKVP